jgi:hypothetical protein
LHAPFDRPGGSQQLSLTLHESVPPTLHVCPAWLHATPLSQRPYWSVGAVFEQPTPQQSLSAVHSSPVGWQPDGFWQTLDPFCPPIGPHAREQHDTSHWTAPGGQVIPATLQLPAPCPPAGPHVPFGFAPTLTQLPLQHWELCTQTSPLWAQNETVAHVPFLQSPEQQSVLTEHPLPVVRHVPPNDAHLPFVQMPLQHWLPAEQLPATGLSGTQARPEHSPLTQKPEQQSPACRHVAPGMLHAPPPGALHTFAVGTPQTPPLAHIAPPPH